jgi:ribosomal protein L37AE/L43A
MSRIFGEGRRACVRCLSERFKRKRAGRDHCIIQCLDCGHNVTGRTFAEAEALWNDYAVWALVDALRADKLKLMRVIL